jgi:hypothetical protein
MTEPLDFTKTGRDRANPPSAPPPTQKAPTQKASKQKAPKQSRAPRTSSSTLDSWSTSKKAVVAAVIVVVLVGIFLVLRSRGGGTSAATKAADAATSCQLIQQFDLLAASSGAASASGTFEGPAPAMAAFAVQAKPIVSQLKSLDSVVGENLDTVMAAAEKAGTGDRAGLASPGFATARQGLLAFQGRSCQTGVESGDG